MRKKSIEAIGKRFTNLASEIACHTPNRSTTHNNRIGHLAIDAGIKPELSLVTGLKVAVGVNPDVGPISSMRLQGRVRPLISHSEAGIEVYPDDIGPELPLEAAAGFTAQVIVWVSKSLEAGRFKDLLG